MALVKKKNDSILNMNNAVANLNNNIKATASNIKNTASAVGSGLQTAYNNAADNIADYLPGFTLLGSTIKNNADLRRYKGDQDKADTELAKYTDETMPKREYSQELMSNYDRLVSMEDEGKAIQEKYADPIQNAIDQLDKYSEFKYDVNSDPIWNSIKSQYQRNATMGMREAMGDAANLTGGYGSSYSQQAGQQAYQNQIAGMTDIIPELQNSALNVFQANQQGAKTKLDSYKDLMRNELEVWQTDRDYLLKKVQDMDDREFNQYLTNLQQWNTNRSFWNEYRNNAIANQQWARQQQAENVRWRQELLYNYAELGVNSALKVADLGLDAASLGVQAGNSLLDYDLSRRELGEKQREFNSLHPDDALPITSPYTQTLNALTGGKSLADLLGGKLSSTSPSGTGDSGSDVKKSGNDNSKPKKSDDDGGDDNSKPKKPGDDGDSGYISPNGTTYTPSNSSTYIDGGAGKKLTYSEWEKSGDKKKYRNYNDYSNKYDASINTTSNYDAMYDKDQITEDQYKELLRGNAKILNGKYYATSYYK